MVVSGAVEGEVGGTSVVDKGTALSVNASF